MNGWRPSAAIMPTSYRHCLFVTGFAVAFAQHLGMREDDQRRLTRAALLHDVGKAFIPIAILDKPGELSDEEMADQSKPIRVSAMMRCRPQAGFPPEMLDVVLHHHQLLDGSGLSRGSAGDRDRDIVRLTTIVDIHAALVEKRAYRLAVHGRQGVPDHGRHGRQARPASAAGFSSGRVRGQLRAGFLSFRGDANHLSRNLRFRVQSFRTTRITLCCSFDNRTANRSDPSFETARCPEYLAADHGQQRSDLADFLHPRPEIVRRQHREIGQLARFQARPACRRHWPRRPSCGCTSPAPAAARGFRFVARLHAPDGGAVEIPLQRNESIVRPHAMRVGAAGHGQPELHRGDDARHLLRGVDADFLLQPLAAEIEPVLHAPDQAERLIRFKLSSDTLYRCKHSSAGLRIGISLLMSSTTSSRS